MSNGSRRRRTSDSRSFDGSPAAESRQQIPPLTAPLVVLLSSLGLLAATPFVGTSPKLLLLVIVIGCFAFVATRTIRWDTILAVLLIVIFFIPIKRYTLPGSLPFNLEPYRILVALVVGVWLIALLADSRLRLRGSGYELPILGLVFAALLSWVVNPHRLKLPGVTTGALKEFTFFLSFILVFYVVVSVVRSLGSIERLLKVLVGCGSIISVLALVERRTNFNIFDHLGFLPLLTFHNPNLDVIGLNRGGRLRVYASAQHPIALAAVLVMLVPVGLYLARRSRPRLWGTLTVLILLGVAATVSRTGVLMLVAELLVLLAVRPREAKQLLPLIPLVIVAALIVAPDTISGLGNALAPQSVIGEQTVLVSGNYSGSGRLTKARRALQEFSHHPILGIGLGTRVLPTDYYILDDQWLGSLLETGAVGVLALLLLFGRSMRRLGGAALRDPTPRGELCGALAASIFAYGAGMATYDAFSFIQVTYVFFFLLGLGSSLLAMMAEKGSEEGLHAEQAPA